MGTWTNLFACEEGLAGLFHLCNSFRIIAKISLCCNKDERTIRSSFSHFFDPFILDIDIRRLTIHWVADLRVCAYINTKTQMMRMTQECTRESDKRWKHLCWDSSKDEACRILLVLQCPKDSYSRSDRDMVAQHWSSQTLLVIHIPYSPFIIHNTQESKRRKKKEKTNQLEHILWGNFVLYRK